MPESSPYPNEDSAQFASRVKGKSSNLTKAAGRYLQTANQKDAKKGIVRNY